MTKNMTGEIMEQLIDLMPENMEPGEISAVMLTIVEAYLAGNMREAINVLLTSTLIYALRVGLPREDVSTLFYAAAEDVKNNNKERMN